MGEIIAIANVTVISRVDLSTSQLSTRDERVKRETQFAPNYAGAYCFMVDSIDRIVSL